MRGTASDASSGIPTWVRTTIRGFVRRSVLGKNAKLVHYGSVGCKIRLLWCCSGKARVTIDSCVYIRIIVRFCAPDRLRYVRHHVGRTTIRVLLLILLLYVSAALCVKIYNQDYVRGGCKIRLLWRCSGKARVTTFVNIIVRFCAPDRLRCVLRKADMRGGG